MRKTITLLDLEKEVDLARVSYQMAENKFARVIKALEPKGVKSVNYDDSRGSKKSIPDIDQMCNIVVLQQDLQEKKKYYLKQLRLLNAYKKKWNANIYTDIEKKVIELNKRQGLTLAEVAVKLGYNENYIYNVNNSIKRKMEQLQN